MMKHFILGAATATWLMCLEVNVWNHFQSDASIFLVFGAIIIVLFYWEM